MKTKIDFFIVNGPNNKGLPYPDEVFNPDDLNDPKALRDLLGAEAIAKKMLPFVDTRARYWRYYLLLAPGRKINIEKRLQKILKKTSKGIGSRKKVKKLETILNKDYRTAASNFWTTNGDGTLLRKARLFRSRGLLDFFFHKKNDDLQKRFHKALKDQSPELSKFLLHKKNHGDDILFNAVINSPSLGIKSIDVKKLMFSWALLQSLYEIIDFNDDDDDENKVDDKNYYLSNLAKTCLEYIKKSTPVTGELSDKQITYIRNLLEHAISQQDYSPPIKISSKKSDGTKRRVFSSFRLRIYTRLLMDTLPS